MPTKLIQTENPHLDVSRHRAKGNYRPTVAVRVFASGKKPIILLVRHKKGGSLTLPQTEIRDGESILDASRRVLFGELALRITPPVLEKLLPNAGCTSYYLHKMKHRCPRGFKKGKAIFFPSLVVDSLSVKREDFPLVENPIVEAHWAYDLGSIRGLICDMESFEKRDAYLEAITDGLNEQFTLNISQAA